MSHGFQGINHNHLLWVELYPLLQMWASLIAQLVKNLPAVQETLLQFLGWGDSLEKGKATHSNILAWRMGWTYILTQVPDNVTSLEIGSYHVRTGSPIFLY